MPYMNHEAGRDCLLEMDRVLRDLQVPFFLMQGTALGAWRDGGFVPTEKDIDLGVLYEDLAPKFKPLMMVLMERGFDVEAFTMPFTRPRTLVAFKSYGGNVVHVDVVGMIKHKDERFTVGPDRDYVQEPYALVHEAEVLEHYQVTSELWGRRFLIPQQIERYLFCEYGPKWRVPVEDHISRTRVYNYVERENLPVNFLEQR